MFTLFSRTCWQAGRTAHLFQFSASTLMHRMLAVRLQLEVLIFSGCSLFRGCDYCIVDWIRRAKE